MMVTMNASPATKSIKNFGHSVKSNLVAKAKQIQQVRQRSQSIQVNDMHAHHTFLLAHLQQIQSQNQGQSQDQNKPEMSKVSTL